MLLKTVILSISDLRYNLNSSARFKLVLFVFFCIFFKPVLADNIEHKALIEKARILFYQSVEDKKYIDEAIEIFLKVKVEPDNNGLAQTYIGALTALKGKHSFWPQDKLDWTQKGLAIMDSGLVKSPDNIEALFIHSSTCYYLPFFFKRGQQAQQNMKKISQLLPLRVNNYDQNLMGNVIRFILEKGNLDPDEQRNLDELLTKLGKT